MFDYLEQHKDQSGVEPICTTLATAYVKIAPSTYYASKKRPTSKRAIRDEQIKIETAWVHESNCGVYGIRKSTPGSAVKASSAPAGSRPSHAARLSGS